ncbi:MAG: glycosyltransferase family 4 protein [Planctomycetota bacterium]|jgi:glycosyltransferase involved in cell wall biosynthesis
MTIRVLHVIDHLGYGGAPVAVKNIAERMAGERIESTVCALRTNPDAMPIEVPLVNLGYHKYNPFAFMAIAKLCRENKIDIVHAHLQKSIISCLLAKSLCDAKIIIHEHGPIFRRGTGCIYRLLLKVLKSRAAIVIANSQATKVALCRAADFDEESVPVVSNFIDFARFDRTLYGRDKARDTLGVAEGRLVVGLVGRLDRCKGADLLIQAAAILCGKSDAYRFVIVGEGSQRRLQGKVVFSGLCKNPAEVMVAFDVAVVPSRREAFGIAAVECMRMKVPVVASAVGGLVEVVRHEKTGILLDPLSSETIAEAVERLARDDSLCQKLRSEAEAFSRKFDGRQQLGQIAQIYEKLCT